MLVAGKARELGLYHGQFAVGWAQCNRHWHVQLRKKETPLMIRGLCDGWADVEREMLSRFEL